VLQPERRSNGTRKEDLRLLQHFAQNQAAGSPLEPTPEYQAVIRKANTLYAEALAEHKASGG
jgi:hypothetical protein